MNEARTLLLFDPSLEPASWNERMVEGEFAVHGSSFASGVAPYCTVLKSLAEAEAFAEQEAARQPELRCRIYDHQGFVGAPLSEVRGQSYVAETEITARFRRWVGPVLLLCGLVLVSVDWLVDFRLTWASTIGSRMMIPGVLLLFIEAMVMLTAWETSRGRVGQRTA